MIALVERYLRSGLGGFCAFDKSSRGVEIGVIHFRNHDEALSIAVTPKSRDSDLAQLASHLSLRTELPTDQIGKWICRVR